MAAKSYDVVVIGGGPGGYVAAIRAAQLGLRTACVDKRGTLGGTCLNIGCIPSKALLQSTEKYAEALHGLAAHGIKLAGVEVDLAAMMARKDKVVSGLTSGIELLFRKNKIDWVKGTARVLGGGRIAVASGNGGEETLEARAIVLATGSDVATLPGIAIDEKRIVSSTGALSLAKVPKRLAVIGGGYIGLEMASVWRRLGAEITVIEFLDRITPGVDSEVSRQLQRVLTKAGFVFKLGAKVVAAEAGKAEVKLTVEPAKGGASEEIKADVVLVAVGRRPYTDGLGLEAAGVALDEKKRIKVDPATFQTNVAGIYAIGDVIAGPMLAHKAEEEGVAVAEVIAGQHPHINYDAIPAVIYTWPEVASVGRTEDELKAAGIAYKVGKFPFMANSRARTNAETDGFVKVLADAKSDRLLGMHIIGPDAGTMIAEAALAIEYGASAEDIARTTHAHPTLNEAVKEAALAVDGRPIHI